MKYLTGFLATAAIYLLIQGMGLWISTSGPSGEKGIIAKIDTGEMPPVIPGEKPDPTANIQIFLYILISTAIILLLLRYKFDYMIRVFISLGLFGGLIITLTSLIGGPGFLAALLLFVANLWKKENMLLMNIVLLFTIPGIGSWIGASPALGAANALILLIILAAYDIVAVFGTKHMVTLAEGAKGKIPLMFAIPVGERTLGLGTGDLAIPLVFSVAVLKDYSMTAAIITCLGGLAGLLALFLYITKKKDVVLPALPPITAGLIIGYGIAILAGGS